MDVKAANSVSTNVDIGRPSDNGLQSFRFDPYRPKPKLTEREKRVLRLVCDGLSNPEIAAALCVSPETVKSELKRIFRKIGVANRIQAAVLLVKQQWV
ncbi:MAG: response regulator transcription factor [Candidatus Binatia bacterium]